MEKLRVIYRTDDWHSNLQKAYSANYHYIAIAPEMDHPSERNYPKLECG